MVEKKTAGGGRSTSTQKPTSRSSKPSPSRKSQATRQSGAKRAPSKPRVRKTTARPSIRKQLGARERLGKWLAEARSVLERVRQRLSDPAFWSGIKERIPPWFDELGAILLIVAGVVALTALLNTSSEAALSVTLSDALRSLFGYGAYIVSFGILAIGVILLLPKFGIWIEPGWARIAAVEIAFGAFAALLHLFVNDPEPRMLAKEGGGGGHLGWALTQVTASLGHAGSLFLFGLIFVAGFVFASGIRRHHVLIAIDWLNERLQHRIKQLDEMPIRPVFRDSDPDDDDSVLSITEPPHTNGNGLSSPGVPGMPYSRPSLVRRDEPSDDDPPGNPAPPPRRGPQPPANGAPPDGSGASELPTAEPEDSAPDVTPIRLKPKPRPLSKKEKQEIANETRRKMGAANGRSLVSPGEPGGRASIVPREFKPETNGSPVPSRAALYRRHNEEAERVFTVEDFQEVKKIGKRADELPPLELLSDVELNKPTEDEINANARIIRNTLLEFDVETEVIDVKVGPTVTQYAVSPYTEAVTEDGEMVLNRVRVSQIANLNSDLALALSAKRLRIQAPVPGHSYVGVEVPNRQPSIVALRPVLESEGYYRHRNHPLALPLGRDVSGEPFIADLQTMPHLLIAGTTGSGKSIMLAAMTTAFVMNNHPDKVKLVLLDPKMVELSRFNGLPHLLGQVETDLDRIIGVLRWATREMDRRYKLLEKEAARNLEVYNQALGRRRKDEHLPYIVLIIDEIGDLMMQRPDETERALTRLAQMARAVGIHLMVATQRPSVDVITGLIKANFPARISFAVASSVDSRVILDYTGAESLMGRGDMLFLAPDAAGPQRIQGCYVTDEEVNAIVDYWRDWHERQAGDDPYELHMVAPWERGMTRREVLAETDPMLEDAIALVVAEGEASASLIQRRLGLGYPRAARIMDLLQELGIVGSARAGGRTREVLVKPGADPFKKIIDKRISDKQ